MQQARSGCGSLSGTRQATEHSLNTHQVIDPEPARCSFRGQNLSFSPNWMILGSKVFPTTPKAEFPKSLAPPVSSQLA